jgi:hypothetical protein
MDKIKLKGRHSDLQIYSLDEQNEIEIENIQYDVSVWLSIDQAKQLIEFLTKQIEIYETRP